MKLTLLSMTFLFSLAAQAEYRVYQYYVKSKVPSLRDADAYLVTSSLDPQSYLAYHGGPRSLELELLRTWICPGHTGGMRPPCPSPYKELAMEKENNETP